MTMDTENSLSILAQMTQMKFLICGGKANRSHYSVFACNSCASYFRRTILLKRNYLCTKRNCHLTGNKPKCKKCRLQKCLDRGMKIDSISIRKALSENDQYNEESVMNRLMSSFENTFVTKINILTKLAHKKQMKLEFGVLKPSRERMEISKLAEYQTLMHYMKDCGYREEFGLREIDLARIAKSAFYKWLIFTALTSTIRNGGHHTSTVHISDCGYLPLSLKNCCDYLREHEVGDVDILGRPYFNLLDKGMQIAHRFHQARLNKTEFALLLQLLILKEAKELFPSIKEINTCMDNLLKEAHEYYEQNYHDVEVKTGELIFLLYDINIDIEYQQFALLLSLTGFKTVLPRVAHDYGIENA